MNIGAQPFGDDPTQHAYRQIMSGVTDRRLDADSFFALWRNVFDSGRIGVDRSLAALVPTDLEWPLFDEWAEHFGDQQPYMWTSARGGRVRPEVLVHYLTRKAYAVGHLTRSLFAFGPLGAEFGKPLPSAVCWRTSFALPEPDLVKEICRQKAAELTAGDWAVTPPFFPGDRTSCDLSRVRLTPH